MLLHAASPVARNGSELAAGNLVTAGQCLKRGGCGAGSMQLKYVLLDASTKHAETLQQAHSVILTSGTLAPLDVLTQQLYRPTDAPRMHEFTCGHIVPPERVLAVGVGCGPGGRRLKLTHGVRDGQAMMDECGQLISNLCRVVPQGCVVFVPSFAYADALKSRCAVARCMCAVRARPARPPGAAGSATQCAPAALLRLCGSCRQIARSARSASEGTLARRVESRRPCVAAMTHRRLCMDQGVHPRSRAPPVQMYH